MAHWLADLANLPTVLLSAALSIVMMLDGIPLFGLLIPADAAVMVAMAAKGPVGSGPILLGVVTGYLVTASCGFLIGRHFGPQVRASRFGRWIGERRWSTGEQLLATNGRRMLMSAPFLPVVNTMVPLIAGGLRVPYRQFVTSVGIGSVVWSTLYVGLGGCAAVVGRALPGGWLTTAATVTIGLLLSLGTVRGARRLLGTVTGPVAVTVPVPVPVPVPCPTR